MTATLFAGANKWHTAGSDLLCSRRRLQLFRGVLQRHKPWHQVSRPSITTWALWSGCPNFSRRGFTKSNKLHFRYSKERQSADFPQDFFCFLAGKSSVYVTWIQPTDTGLGDDTSLNLEGHEVLSLLAVLVQK